LATMGAWHATEVKGDRCGKDHRAVRLMLDVHKSSVTACVRIPDENEALHQEIREFATTTRGLLVLRNWLASFEVRLVGMEATGVYWKPIYYMLEDDFELWLLNARHLKRTSPVGRPTSRTLSGSASLWSTGWCAPASCHPKRSGSLGTSPATARRRSRSAQGRSNVLRRCSKMPG
jgi:transposase